MQAFGMMVPTAVYVEHGSCRGKVGCKGRTSKGYIGEEDNEKRTGIFQPSKCPPSEETFSGVADTRIDYSLLTRETMATVNIAW